MSISGSSGREIVSVRDCVAHMLQLCEYIEDAASMPKLTDWAVIVNKAKQVRQILREKGPTA